MQQIENSFRSVEKEFQPTRSRDRFLTFGSPEIGEAEIEEMVATLRSGWLGTGPRTTEFESRMATYKSCEYAVAVNSCTAALHLSLLASELQPGDEVITTALTFCASVNAIIHSGATPVLADINPATMNIDPESVEQLINSRTKAILPVHFAGRPCDMDSLCALADRHNLKIIEDCAHAVETTYRGQAAGTFGDFGCLSFYATKNVVTGEGGMVLTSRKSDVERIRMLGLHGMSKNAWKRFSDEGYKHYFVKEAGFKYNMTDMQAALGIHQLARVDANWQYREQIWNRYNQAFANLPLTLPTPPEADTRHAYHLYTVLVDRDRTGLTRDDFLDHMTRHNIGVGVHYLSIPEHPFYREKLGWRCEDFPEAKRIGRQTVSLPISPKLTAADVEDVITAVTRIIAEDA